MVAHARRGAAGNHHHIVCFCKLGYGCFELGGVIVDNPGSHWLCASLAAEGCNAVGVDIADFARRWGLGTWDNFVARREYCNQRFAAYLHLHHAKCRQQADVLRAQALPGLQQQSPSGCVIIAKNNIVARGLTAGDFNEVASRRAGVFNHHHAIRALRQHARDAVQTANDQLNNVRKQLEGNRVLVDNTTLADHPRVKMAAARLREAYLAWRRTQVPAPVSGQVARRSVQVGQRTAPGTPLMAVVPLEQLWVDANFKEGQLSAMGAMHLG